MASGDPPHICETELQVQRLLDGPARSLTSIEKTARNFALCIWKKGSMVH